MTLKPIHVSADTYSQQPQDLYLIQTDYIANFIVVVLFEVKLKCHFDIMIKAMDIRSLGYLIDINMLGKVRHTDLYTYKKKPLISSLTCRNKIELKSVTLKMLSKIAGRRFMNEI